ncbi:MAG: response regulator [Opitutaceae bacterium]
MNESDPSPAAGPPPPRRLRILYADDVRELREIARLSFQRDGHEIECVDDGTGALDRIIAAPDYDLLITDHCMPVMDGLELVTHVRDRKFAGKIVVFSSELSSEVAQAYRRAQVDRILYKPIFPSRLREILAELFPESSPTH